MIVARARVPSTCMIWQVVPSTGTCKSINLDLARAARYRYFTKNRPAHADQNSDQSILLLAVNLPAVRVGHGVGPGWERSRRAGPRVGPRQPLSRPGAPSRASLAHTNGGGAPSLAERRVFLGLRMALLSSDLTPNHACVGKGCRRRPPLPSGSGSFTRDY